jgi:hypothetical protein
MPLVFREGDCPVHLHNACNVALSRKIANKFQPGRILLKTSKSNVLPTSDTGRLGWRKQRMFCLSEQINRSSENSSGRPQSLRHFRAALPIVPDVPAIHRFRFGFDGAMREHRIIDSAADDTPSGRCSQRIGVFIAA